MKKRLLSMLLASSMVISLAACGNSNGGNEQGSAGSQKDVTVDSSELVDGKFTETRTITVEVYDRGNDGGSDPTDNLYTQYLQIGEALSSKRDQVYDTAVSASTADFESVWESGMQDYLTSGGQAIIDERKTAWENTYGDAENLPEK